jgi:PAS domain S-box-containing protein
MVKNSSETETRLREELETLRRECAFYREIVNTQPAGIYRVWVFPRNRRQPEDWMSSANSPYTVELVSDRFCEILGISRKEFEAKPGIVNDRVHPEDKVEFARRNEETNTRENPFQWEGRLIVAGKTLWVHFESLPQPAENGDTLWTGILYDISERKRAEAERERLIRELQDALSNIRTLRGMLPICSNCKKVRDDKGYWNQIETYIRDHSEAEFSHGICPQCFRALYPGMEAGSR